MHGWVPVPGVDLLRWRAACRDTAFGFLRWFTPFAFFTLSAFIHIGVIAMLQVYGASVSPFVRKVLLALEFKGVPYEGVAINPFAPPANWATLSPLKKIPVLVDGDVVLPDSTIICRYIEETQPTPALYPTTAAWR